MFYAHNYSINNSHLTIAPTLLLPISTSTRPFFTTPYPSTIVFTTASQMYFSFIKPSTIHTHLATISFCRTSSLIEL